MRSATAPATFTIGQATPRLSVSDAGGTYNGTAFPASASVTGVGGAPGSSLEGVSPTLTYYAGSTASGTPLAGAQHRGHLHCRSHVPWQHRLYGRQRSATFTIGQTTPTVSVTDAGGTYNGTAFPAAASVTGVGGTPGSSLEGVARRSPTTPGVRRPERR